MHDSKLRLINVIQLNYHALLRKLKGKLDSLYDLKKYLFCNNAAGYHSYPSYLVIFTWHVRSILGLPKCSCLHESQIGIQSQSCWTRVLSGFLKGAFASWEHLAVSGSYWWGSAPGISWVGARMPHVLSAQNSPVQWRFVPMILECPARQEGETSVCN